ncbi:MAG: ABC transporter ATP-binding protein [Alphaproteobacteria bacterium]|nr:ABC transporter ATP-binding protein [Alphaproteobacteria bacterium]
MTTVLKLKNISKEFIEPRRNIVALNKINLELSDGQCIGLLGPSGSGKSTLLQIAGLLDTPTNGEIIINGEKCNTLSQEKKNLIRKKYIGFIYQNFYLLDSFSALENIIIPQLINGSTYKSAKKKALNLLSNIGLSKRIDNKPRELSGGEKQRVAILRAIANTPKIILADEPTGNLDKKNSENVIKIIKDLVSHYKISFIVATHNLSIVKKFDKIIKLSEGKLI